jgi:sulfhydrogenase subunit delta
LSQQQSKPKVKIGVYALTSCYGCQLKIATVSKILEIAEAVDIVSFYMVSSNSSMHERVDIAFVEGSVSTEKDLEELMEIRKNSKILVGVGACALQGGVQSWDWEEKTYDEMYKAVYGDTQNIIQGKMAEPITNYVPVDYKLYGCPPEEDEILYYISTFLFGTWPERKDYPVCHECRLKGNPCILIERGEPCLGPVTTAGCDARCISHNVPCIGCRGPVPQNAVWFDSLAKTMKERGYSKEYIKARMRIFNSHHHYLGKYLEKAFGGTEE